MVADRGRVVIRLHRSKSSVSARVARTIMGNITNIFLYSGAKQSIRVNRLPFNGPSINFPSKSHLLLVIISKVILEI